MSINIKPSHEGKFHEWAKVPNGQEIPMSKIKEGQRSPDPKIQKEARFADNAPHWNHDKYGPAPKSWMWAGARRVVKQAPATQPATTTRRKATTRPRCRSDD